MLILQKRNLVDKDAFKQMLEIILWSGISVAYSSLAGGWSGVVVVGRHKTAVSSSNAVISVMKRDFSVLFSVLDCYRCTFFRERIFGF